MSFLSVRKIAAFSAVLAALAFAAPGFAQTGGASGKATMQDGSPCVKCPVILERMEIHGVYKTKTNKKGQYVYIGLPIGNYKITLQNPQGSNLFYIEKHIGLGEPTEVDFDLAKLLASQKQEREKEIAANPELAKKVEEQKKEKQEFTGLKALFDQGNAFYGEKNYKAAAAAYEKALPLAKDKNVPVVLMRLADSYHKAGENQQSIDTYQKALKLTPDDANLHNNLGTVYADMGKFTEAQSEFEKAAQLDPAGASRYYFNIGAIMYNAGKMDEAAAAFKKVIDADPKNAQAYYLEGQSLMAKVTMTPDGKVKAPDGTVEAFEQYLKLEPNGPNAPAARQMIQTLQGNVETQYKKKGKS